MYNAPPLSSLGWGIEYGLFKPPFTPCAEIHPFRIYLTTGVAKPLTHNDISVQEIALYNEGNGATPSVGNVAIGTSDGVSVQTPTSSNDRVNSWFLPAQGAITIPIDNMRKLYLATDTVGVIVDVMGMGTPHGGTWDSYLKALMTLTGRC